MTGEDDISDPGYFEEKAGDADQPPASQGVPGDAGTTSWRLPSCPGQLLHFRSGQRILN